MESKFELPSPLTIDFIFKKLKWVLFHRNVWSEEKRRIEAKIAELEEELEDEQNNNEQMLDKFKKLQFDLEKMTSDLQAEKSNGTKNEVNIFYDWKPGYLVILTLIDTLEIERQNFTWKTK